jgi:uncharacterized membrane protein YphA (DoxX/SURF4 family)
MADCGEAGGHRPLHRALSPRMTDTLLRLLPPRCGPAWFLAGLAAIGVVALVAGRSAGPLVALPGSVPAAEALVRGFGAVLAGLSFACMVAPRSLRAARLLAGGLLLWLLAARVPQVVFQPAGVAARVAAVEVLAAFAVSLSLAQHAAQREWPDRFAGHGSRVPVFARWAVAAMLIVFGLTHLQHRAAIASMIPAWLPGRTAWPWFTGSAHLAAGLALLTGLGLRPAALAVGLMFASWLPLVHAGRLVRSPTVAAEWAFAVTAVMLCGVVWTLAALARPEPGRAVGAGHGTDTPARPSGRRPVAPPER